MTSMTDLHLSFNRLTGSIPSALANLKKLARVYLDQNNLGGIVPPLPFEQYSTGTPTSGACSLDNPKLCQGPVCNRFSCPLPANLYNSSFWPCLIPGGGGSGVHCNCTTGHWGGGTCEPPI
jgi:hypothetical protein